MSWKPLLVDPNRRNCRQSLVVRHSERGKESRTHAMQQPRSIQKSIFSVLKPDGLVGVVNTILINHLPEDNAEPSHKSVETAYTLVEGGVY